MSSSSRPPSSPSPSFLNGSTRGLNRRETPRFQWKDKRRRKRGFPIKDFGNDGGRRSSPWNLSGSKHLNQRKAKFGLIKISGMTKKVRHGLLPLLSPRNLRRGPEVFENLGCLIKDFRHDERGGFPPEFQA